MSVARLAGSARPVEARGHGVDAAFASIVVALAFAGVAVAGSARAYREALESALPLGVLSSLVHVGIGLVLMTAVVLIDYRRLARPGFVWTGLVVVSALLLAALFTPARNATHRWISLFGVSIQPSELAKPLLVIALAATLTRAGTAVRTWEGLARPLLVVGWLAGLVLAGRDLGTPVLLGGTAVAVIYAAGARWRHALGLSGAAGVLFLLFAFRESYRVERLASFLDALRLQPGAIDQVQHQLRQSLIAIGSGGLFGKGFGSSTQKALFLPEADNDFVFSVIGEELGLVGALSVLVAFLVLAWRGMAVAERAPDEVGRLIALGATWLVAGQALCHIGVGVGVLPTKGLPLPFVSTGGSSLLASFALAGLVLNVSLRRRRHEG